MSRIVESLYAKYGLNEEVDNDYGLEIGKIYQIDYNVDGNPAEFKYIAKEKDNGFDSYKFKPINKVAEEVAKEEAQAGDFEYDGYLYMDDDGVYYTFFDGEEDEDIDEISDISDNYVDDEYIKHDMEFVKLGSSVWDPNTPRYKYAYNVAYRLPGEKSAIKGFGPVYSEEEYRDKIKHICNISNEKEENITFYTVFNPLDE